MYPLCYIAYMPTPVSLRDVDAILIRYADTESATAISFRIEGILTPRQVAARIDHLLEVPDRLTAIQQDQLITLKMRQLVVELEELPRTTRNAEVLFAGLERIGNRLDKRQESTEKELNSLYAFQGRAFLEAITDALEYMKERLTNAEAIDPAEWDASLEAGIRRAQIKLNGYDIDREPEPATPFDIQAALED